MIDIWIGMTLAGVTLGSISYVAKIITQRAFLRSLAKVLDRQIENQAELEQNILKGMGIDKEKLQ